MSLEFEEIILTRMRYRAQQRFSRQLLAQAKLETMADDITDSLIVGLEMGIYGQEDRATYEIEEKPVYRSWKHHLVSELPDGFWRRFFIHLWSLEDEPLATQVRHTVTTDAKLLFPNAEIAMPSEFGNTVRIASIRQASYVEERHV